MSNLDAHIRPRPADFGREHDAADATDELEHKPLGRDE